MLNGWGPPRGYLIDLPVKANLLSYGYSLHWDDESFWDMAVAICMGCAR